MRNTFFLGAMICLVLGGCGSPMLKPPALNGTITTSLSSDVPSTVNLPLDCTSIEGKPIVVRKINADRSNAAIASAVLFGPLGILAHHALTSNDGASKGESVAISHSDLVTALRKELDASAKSPDVVLSFLSPGNSNTPATLHMNAFLVFEIEKDNRIMSSVVLQVDDASKGASNIWHGQYTYHDPVVVDASNMQKELTEGMANRVSIGLNQDVSAYLRDVTGNFEATPIRKTIYINGDPAFASVQPIDLLGESADGKSIFRAKCHEMVTLCFGVHIIQKNEYTEGTSVK